RWPGRPPRGGRYRSRWPWCACATPAGLDVSCGMECRPGGRRLHRGRPGHALARSRVASVADVDLQPRVAAGLVDPDRVGRVAEVGIAGQVEVLAVGAVEHVVHAGGDLHHRVDAVAGIERQGGEAGAGTEV